MGTKYLITGGAGFIGSNFIKYVLKEEKDIEVVNLDNLEYSGNLENLIEVEEDKRYSFVRGDVCNESLVNELFEKKDFDVVVHFAALTHVDRSIEDAKPFVRTNIEGTRVLLESARVHWAEGEAYKPNKKFIYVSTDEVYGDLKDGEYFTEETPVAPRNPYSASKTGAEMLVRAYSETHKLPIGITRCSNNYGPNQFPEKLIPLLINNCLNKKQLPIYGTGKNVRDWLYVEDHCRAILTILKNGKNGEIYNIGGHNEKTTLDIAYTVVDYIHEKYDKSVTRDLITMVKDRKGHDTRYAIDPRKTNEELKWKPQTDFETGIRKTIDWYMSNKEWLSRVISDEYRDYYKKHYETK